MNRDIEILRERIDDLECQIVELNSTIYREKKRSNVELYASQSTFLFFLPVAILVFVLLGLNVNYQSEKHQISYTNNNLTELALSGLTVVSGLYTLKKHRDKQKLTGNNI